MRIAEEIPIRGMSFGLPAVARSAAVQRAEARLGIVCLVSGFLLQATAYFFPHPSASLHTWPERALGLALIAGTWVIASASYRLYVPWSAARVYHAASIHSSSAIG
jgi:hypothetical protein